MAGKLHQPAIKAVDAGFGGVGAVGRALFSDGLVPFEVSSALLMVAILGAVAVAKGRQGTVAQVLPSGQPGLAPRASIQPHGGAKAGESRGGDDE
jgi:NADH-quinone oxidoreductase subunit J